MGLTPGPPGARGLSCVSYKHPSVRGSLGGGAGGGPAPGTIRCPPRHCCIGIWNRSRALVQGCWGGGGSGCPSPACAPSPAGGPGATVLVCLCHGHLCNGNASGGPPRDPPVPGRAGPAGPLWLWGGGGLVLVLLLACLAVLAWGQAAGPSAGLRRARARGGQPPRGGSAPGTPPELPSQELQALRFLQVLQAGRFSAVWRGTLHQRPVAIKAFAAGAGGRFAAERAVLALPLMQHRNVARLLGARRPGPRARGGLLLLQLYPAGSLRHFLRQHVGTWAGSLRLALSLARGLAFLHQEQWRDGLYKPSVVHRDLSSQNVLVREDGTCAIGDFGLALALPPPRSSARRAVPIRKAGTQRYLAPEILDESLDLRAWGRALRQADVYALALLLWEILSRCQALSPGRPVPEFRLAYEAELGASPSPAQLRRLAALERRRPLIPPAWHRAGRVAGGLPELLEDCWDPDPEARLSAERAQQRLQRLAAAAPPHGRCPRRGPRRPGAPRTCAIGALLSFVIIIILIIRLWSAPPPGSPGATHVSGATRGYLGPPTST
ncbi:anti-Muellerian hormone type-2 receptor [Eudromia elegans]